MGKYLNYTDRLLKFSNKHAVQFLQDSASDLKFGRMVFRIEFGTGPFTHEFRYHQERKTRPQ